jgi:hypothetical protein
MATKIDLRKERKYLYNPSSKQIAIVDVPKMNFLMIDGQGNPNTSVAYRNAVEALYAVSYTLKFMVKQGDQAVDYAVMPLEGLWWVEDMKQFDMHDKDAWKWTSMIMQPEYVTAELFQEALRQVRKKKDLPVLSGMRFESFREGQAAQILYFGPYSDEGPTIERIHRFILEQGRRLRGRHHEIYLSDPRRTAPAKLKTIIRQPFD